MTPADIEDMLTDAEFQALPFDQRQTVAERAIGTAGQWVAENGGWTPEKWRTFGDLAQQTRTQIADSETLGEKAAWAGGVVVDTLKDAIKTAGVGVAGLSPVAAPRDAAGGGSRLEAQMPGKTLGKSFAANAAALATGVADKLLKDAEPVDTELAALRTEIDQGAFFDHPKGVQGWLDDRAQAVQAKQAKYYEDENWAQQNDLLANPDNAALLNDYLLTRSPQSWDALRSAVLRTPGQEMIRAAKQDITQKSALGRSFPGNEQYISEATDPAELAGTVFSVGAGKLAITGGRNLMQRGAALAGGVAAETAGEQVSAFMDDPNMTWEQRREIAKQSVIASLGLAGVGAGVTAAKRALTTTPENASVNDRTVPMPPADQTVPDAGTGAGSTPAAGSFVSPLPGIAQRAGTVDVAPLVPGLEAEDLGPLTAADVTDLNPAPAAAPTRQPILTNVPDARTAAQIAESQRIEEARQAKEAEMRMLDAKARGMPLIPDSPMGSRDILDWANENPIYLPPGFSEDRKLPEYESLKRNPLPNYWRQFVASAKQGGNPDSVAQRAFDAGLIPEPSADAYFAALQDGIAARKQYRVQFQARDKALAQEEKRVVDFEKSQTKLAKKPAAQEVPFDEIVPGDRMTIDGENAVVKNVEYNEDGYLTNVVIEDGKRFGLMQFDAQNRGGILVDEFKPQPRQAVEDFELGDDANQNVGADVFIEMMTPEQLYQIGAALDVEKANRRWNAAREANNPREGDLASMDFAAAKAGAGPNAQRIEQERMQAVDLAVRQGRPVSADAMENWAKYPSSNGFDATGNIPRRGIPAGYQKQGSIYVAVTTTTLPATSAATTPAPASRATSGPGAGGQTIGETSGGALLDVAPSARPLNRGETAAPQRADVLAELGAATREGEANQAQGRLGLGTGLNPSGMTAGFVNADIVNEALDLIQQGFTTFANWSQAMLTRFGKAIRQYLAGLWQHVQAQVQDRRVTFAGKSFVLPAPTKQGFVANPFHKPGEAFRVKAQVGRALLTGSPLPKDFTKVLDATDHERRAFDQTAALVGRDLAAAVKAFAKRSGMLEQAVWDQVEPVMTGQPGALAVLNALDANLGERARRARNLLDDLSAAVARTMPAGEMRNTILGNLGQWMRRGYAAFDPESGWSFDRVTAAAKDGKLIGGKDAALILANARTYLQGQNPGATAAEIEADMRDLMDRDTWQSALLGGTVKKAVGSLMRRKDIAPEIRALMGEETNPLHRYLQSAKFQAQLIARHHGQVAMRTIGLATGLLKATRGGVYTVEIPKEGYRWSGLGGTFTTPEMMQALENSSGILQDGNTWGGWLVKTLKVLGNEAKLNRVAMNPDSWLVNVLGGFMSTVQSGDIFATGLLKSFKQQPSAADRSFASRVKEAGSTIGSSRTAATANALQDAQRALLARLTEQGVIGSSITLADIEASLPRHLLQWVAESETRDRALGAVQGALIGQSIGRGAGVTGRAIGGALGAVGGAVAGTQNLQKWRQKVAEWTMTKPDNLFRVTGWLTNYETALAAGMQPDTAAKWASERTLNTFPNYNALPAVLREFSKLGLVGSFIAFTHEVYRNTYWNIRYALREIGSGNQALQARGLQRLAGLSSIAALTFGGGLASMLGMSGAAGADDERNKMFRKWFAAPWERDAVLAFDKFTPESVSYLNTSYLLPQVTLQELAQAAGEGLSEGEAVQRVLGRVWEQFAGSSVHLSPIINAALNVDRNGRPITNRPGLAGVLERVDSAVATIGEPGFAEKMTRIAYALRDAERRGRKFSVEQEVKRLFGLRGYERTWDTLVKGRYSKFGAEYQAIRDDANRMLGENLPGAQVKAVEEANARIAELDKQRVQFEQDMQRLGIAPMIVRAAQKESAFNKLNPVRLRADGKRVEAVTVRR